MVTIVKHEWHQHDRQYAIELDEALLSEIYPDLPKTDGARIIDGLMFKHWNAWEDYAFSHIFVATYADGSMGTGVDIMPNEKWDSPTTPFGGDEQISFSPDGKKLAYTCKKLNGTDAAVSTNNDIYIDLRMKIADLLEKKCIDLDIGGRKFTIPAGVLNVTNNQTYVLSGQGIPIINTKNMYDISNKASIIVNIELF